VERHPEVRGVAQQEVLAVVQHLESQAVLLIKGDHQLLAEQVAVVRPLLQLLLQL
jgi:hypothetical protein